MAGATVFLENPSILLIRFRGAIGQYVGDRGGNSLEWTAGAAH
jgi:hypothetical protein